MWVLRMGAGLVGPNQFCFLFPIDWEGIQKLETSQLSKDELNLPFLWWLLHLQVWPYRVLPCIDKSRFSHSVIPSFNKNLFSSIFVPGIVQELC